MNTSPHAPIATREEHPEATVIRINIRKILFEREIVAVKEVLTREAETGNRLIIDLSNVEYFCSGTLGLLISLRRKLSLRGREFQPPCRRGMFALFPDQAAALDAIRQGEPDPLLLCGVHPQVADQFKVC